MSSFELARRHGAGLVLTDGTSRYRVSDWSDGTCDVFGHVWEDGNWTRYQKLPKMMSIWIDKVELYENSPHRAPEGSYADRQMREGLAADQGPAYGESTDPVLRTRRRLHGPDGLRDDIHDMARPFHDAMDVIREEARHVAADMVRVRLVRLEETLTRHRFTAVSCHLTAYSLEVSPPVRHFGAHPSTRIDILVDKEGWLGNGEHPFQDLGAWINGISSEIAMIITRFADEFSMDIGRVTSDREKDIATCYGLLPERVDENTAEAVED